MYISPYNFIVLIFDNTCMYHDMTNDKKISLEENENKIKMLLRQRIEPMPTENLCVSRLKSIKNLPS